MARLDPTKVIEGAAALSTLLELFGARGRVPRFVRKLGSSFTRAMVALSVVQPVADLADYARLSGCTVKIQAIDATGAVVDEVLLDEPHKVAVWDGVEDAAERVLSRVA
jgi:hypothetical protein